MNSPALENERLDSLDSVSCVVSGSFKKFKPEIDETIDRLQGSNALVLAPDKGWLYIPFKRIISPDEFKFRPLPSEVGMSEIEVELQFLRDVKRSDFIYVVNLGGYVGNSVCIEMGTAMGLRIPIYCAEPLLPDPDLSPGWPEVMEYVRVATPEEAVQRTQDDKRFMEEFESRLLNRFPSLHVAKLAAPEIFTRMLRLAARNY